MRPYVRTVIKSAVALGFAATMAMGAFIPAKVFNVNGPGFHVWIGAFTTITPVAADGTVGTVLGTVLGTAVRRTAARRGRLLGGLVILNSDGSSM